MPNIASVLKEEIARLARKELRAETGILRKASAQYRSEIAALKRRIAELERQISRLLKKIPQDIAAPEAAPTARPARFTARGLRAHRQRLGLSAAEFGALLGVSAQTIYSWESESTHPRARQVAAFAALRGVGKREARARLQGLAQRAGQKRGGR